MKTIYTSVLLFTLCFIACSNPQKFIEKGQPHRAYKTSLRKCQTGKIKAKNVEALEDSYELLTIEDAEMVNTLVGEESLSVWPQVYSVAQRIESRQKQVIQVSNKLQHQEVRLNLRHYPVNDLLEEAADKSALYFYNEALAFIGDARNGNRPSARTAYAFLQKCQNYRPEFKDATDLEAEMYELGTTYILFNPIVDESNSQISNDLFKTVFRKQTFPRREGWHYLMMDTNPSTLPHFEVNVSFANLYVSPNQTSSSSCTTSKEIEDGFIEKQVWSEKDSAFVTEKEIKYKTVTATVTTTEQTKMARLDFIVQIFEVDNQTIISEKSIRGCDRWSNEYSEVCGDSKALSLLCDDDGGSCSSFPSDRSMLIDAASGFKRQLFKEVKRLE